MGKWVVEGGGGHMRAGVWHRLCLCMGGTTREGCAAACRLRMHLHAPHLHSPCCRRKLGDHVLYESSAWVNIVQVGRGREGRGREAAAWLPCQQCVLGAAC